MNPTYPVLPFLLMALSCALACGEGPISAPERGPLGAADSLGSCAGGDFCGGQATDCFCDAQCQTVGDCCFDYLEICEAGPSESIALQVSGYVAGDVANSEAAGKSTWAAACESWQQDLQNRFGAATATSCGDPVDLDSSFPFHFASAPSATLTVSVGVGETLIESSAGRSAIADLSNSRSAGLASFTVACTEQMDRYRAIYGARLVAATCAEPTDLDSSFPFLYESPVQLWLRPMSGQRVSGVEYAVGNVANSMSAAIEGFQDACASVVTSAVAHSGGHLELAECDQRVDLDSSFPFHYASEVSVTFVGASPVASSPPPVAGERQNSKAASLVSWRTACDAQLSAIRERDGDRLVGAVCGVPIDTDSSFPFLFESQPTIWHQQ